MTRPDPWILGSAAAALGSSLASGLAGLCCVGPVSVALLGVGGTLAATRLTPYRPVLLAAGLILLAYAFWRAYRARTTVSGRPCPVRAGRAARAMLWIAAAAWLAAVVLPGG